MKLSTTKPISSPARIDKFPPPLMRFLRTNAGNRSRGRSKSSNSMFQILRKKNTTSLETKEPSSPKVTCMGQVRVKRSSKQPTKKGISGDGPPTKCRCRFWWAPHTECWFRRKGKASKVSTKNVPKSKESEREEQQHEEEENRVVKVKVKVKAFVSHANDCSSSFCSTPPRNALLLTRCKSAPYRSSSLASRFWSSPIRNEETEQLSEKQAVSRLRFFKELEDSVRERMSESESVGELKRKEEVKVDSVAFPIVLTRCKSERTRRF
ncbi:unnamed protein product [Lathyrus oleraceus]|uniref:uncharacterized protein LOC127098651 n=1 Tax=Pisum sativum TaxID=3888 RepID=UPI001FC56F70|nr:uncharacterized protein LOC127098651 [Pisum sativum]